MTRIIAYENDEIKICENVCDSRNEKCCEKMCCADYFEEIKKLCQDDLLDGFKIDYKNQKIKCSGYTGYFQLKDGTEVTVLPKIKTDDYKTGEQIFKNLMFNAFNITNIKIASDSDTDLKRENLFLPILIRIFCSLMEKLFKRGIKKFYSPQQENLPYLKGKIIFSEHIKRNITSKEKFFVEYDEFTDDIAENRVLKSACEYLLPKSNDEDKKLLRRFLFEFSDIEKCKNLDKDFAKIQPNRLYNHYDEPLRFARVFLRNKSFNPEHGNKKFPALLFSLHDLFEDYIQTLLNEFKKESDFSFSPQYNSHYLLYDEKSSESFKTKMDFVLWNNKDKNKATKAIVMDAKYKLINLEKDINESKDKEEEKSEEKYYYNPTNINQRDLYQVFTYSQIIKKCESNIKEVEIALLYPITDDFKEKKPYYYFDGTKITFVPINLAGEDKNKLNDNKILKEFIENNLTLS